MNNYTINKLLIKEYYTSPNFVNGTVRINFDNPFPKECICVLINDSGNSNEYQTFMVGHVDKDGFTLKSFDKAYSVKDYIKVIAFGY